MECVYACIPSLPILMSVCFDDVLHTGSKSEELVLLLLVKLSKQPCTHLLVYFSQRLQCSAALVFPPRFPTPDISTSQHA